MHILSQKNLAKKAPILCLSAIFLINSVAQKAYGISTEPKDSASAISIWEKQLKTKMPSSQDKHPPRYILEIQIRKPLSL